MELLEIPNVLISNRSIREIVILHAHLLLAHLGAYKTLQFLQNYVWWKTMSQDVQRYCETCGTCKRSKLNNQRLYKLLNSLTVPTKP